MDALLVSSKAAAQNGFHGNQRVHIVLGSTSCDLDSVASSLAMAYFLSRMSSSLPGCSLVLPVLNIPRSQFHLRADVLLLLREAGITTETLVFRDEIDLARLHGNRRLALTLVDHNVLPSTDSILEGAVVEVIDHHHLERTTSFTCPVTVEMVASCTTLVMERILSRAPEILDQQLALLLYGVMVVDCVNLSPVAGKVTDKDSQMVRLLQMQFPDLPQRDALHTALQTAKFDLSGFTTEQILLNNMKTVAGSSLRVAVSIIYMTLDLFLQRKDLQQELCSFCQSHCLDAIVAMMISFNSQSDESVRQLAVYSSNPLYGQEISHTLLKSLSPALCLLPVSSPYKDILTYQQGNSLASRRKVLPVLTHFLSEWWQREVHCGADGEELEDQLDQSDVMISDTFLVNKESTSDSDWLPHIYTACSHHWRRLQLGAEDYGNVEEDYGGRKMPPPPPMNSLVDGCPLDGGFNQEALLEKFNRMGGGEEEHVGRGN
ncbi:exopolyphosphatase PRUNE1-like isoform X2 [Toxotes jaculatrix]|nr:exopolyphosphatase PRUNE1-like isoform X2 [Toxotes jaculatrix]XP_040909157.1 exopolyphosphatase PRUNE1-like isoform X2 [Toxotes jaculatrix]XP_040909158.1 exopolyphosphatase PRUNE1-like isoform X2 [Toxotes jaculatrix]